MGFALLTMRDAAARWPSWCSSRAIATRGATACGLLRLRLGVRLRVGVRVGVRVRVRVSVSADGRRVEVVQRALVVGLAHAQHGTRLERVRVATLEGESAAHLVQGQG